MNTLKLNNKIFNLDAFCAFEIDSENWVIWAYFPRLDSTGELEYIDLSFSSELEFNAAKNKINPPHATAPLSTTPKSRIPTLSPKKISPFKS